MRHRVIRGRAWMWLAGGMLIWAGVLRAQEAPPFDGRRAYELLEAQVALGPRYPGSPGHAKMVAFLDSHLTAWAHAVGRQVAVVRHPYKTGTFEITNILARFNPDARSRILLLAHYDTREMADEDPDPANRSRPILGANDGASGVAILLTLAEIMSREPPEIGVDLLFADAEDMGRSGDLESWALGTKAFVPRMVELLGGVLPRYAVLLDMVGDAQLDLPVEYYSWREASDLVRRVWQLANDLGYEQFRLEFGTAVYDDHVPLLEAGIPAIDIIDFEYPNSDTNYWQTLDDTPDKCSAESLEAVGTVVTTLVYRERP